MHERNDNEKHKVNRFIVSFVKRSSNLKYACYQHKSMCNRILGLAPIKNGRLAFEDMITKEYRKADSGTGMIVKKQKGAQSFQMPFFGK